ncbi:MAG: DUF502 domain-containing protein [Pirellulales bacterium]
MSDELPPAETSSSPVASSDASFVAPSPLLASLGAGEPVKVLSPFRLALLRGLGAFLAPLLTVVILVWVWQTLKSYVLEPVTQVVREVAVWSIADIHDEMPADGLPDPQNPDIWTRDDVRYARLESGQYVPEDVQRIAARERRAPYGPQSARSLSPLRRSDLSARVDRRSDHLGRVLGRDVRRGGPVRGRRRGVMWRLFEYLVQRVPLVRAVYVPVKQVTSYLFDREGPRFSRVVAVEYPRRGIWTLAFVTGEGLVDIERITGEPMLTILFPTCPVPVTGNVKVIAKREVVDLDVTIEQAAQYVVSYGVVIDEASVKKGELPKLDVEVATG